MLVQRVSAYVVLLMADWVDVAVEDVSATAVGTVLGYQG